jgi:tetratricopeptide (TPR) repeat protein
MAENIDELYMRGRDAFDKRDYKEAELCFLEVVKTRPYADVFNKLGQIFHNNGELGKAASAFKKALEINPSYTEVSLNLAVTLNDMGSPSGQAGYFQKAAR